MTDLTPQEKFNFCMANFYIAREVSSVDQYPEEKNKALERAIKAVVEKIRAGGVCLIPVSDQEYEECKAHLRRNTCESRGR